MNFKSITKAVAAIAFTGMTFSTSALTITDPNVVGAYNGGYAPGQTEIGIAQTILDLPGTVGVTYVNPPGGTPGTYQSGTLSTLSGTLTLGTKDDSERLAVPAGWDYVIAKYNGQNGGAVLFYLGGAATTLPAVSNPLWGNVGTDQYALSHWTTFNSTPRNVPDGGSTVALLGLGMLGLTTLRRKLKS